MTEGFRKIEAIVAKARSKRAAVKTLRALIVSLAVAAAVLLFGLLVLPALGGTAKLVIRGLVLAGLFGSGILFIVLAVKGRENEEGTALAIEQANPWLNNSLINAVQLVKAARKEGPHSAFSAVFLEKHIEESAQLVDRVDLDRAVPRHSLKKPGIALVVLVLLLAGSWAVMPGRHSSGLAALMSDPWKLPEKEKGMEALPLTTGDFTVRYGYPAYSGIGPQTVKNSNGDLAALRGTSINLETEVLERLESASIVTSGGTRYAMKVEDGTLLEAELVFSEAGSYFIEGIGVDGKKYAEAGSHRMVLDEDLPPKAVIKTPVTDVEVAAEGSLEVSYEVEDDFGVREIVLLYERDGEEARVPVKTMREDGVNSYEGSFEWHLSEHDFGPGERIPFFIEVTDNDEVAGGKSAKSDMRVLEIFSARKYHRQLLARQDELMDRMIDHLAAHIVTELDDREGADMVDSEKKLLLDARDVVTTITGLLADMAEDEYREDLMMDALSDMASRYPPMLGERARMVEGKEKLADNEKIEITSLRDVFRQNFEYDLLYIDKLIKKQRIEDLLAEADDLYKAQADMADLLSQYKRTGDPAVLEELRDLMQELQSKFESLMKRMAEMRKGLPEEFINSDAMDSSNVKNMASEMEKLRQALADGDVDDAAKMAEDFLAMMNTWMSSLEQSAGSMGETMSRETMARLQEVGERINDLVQREKVIEDALSEIQKEAMEQSESMDAMDEARRKVQEGVRAFQEDAAETQQSFYKLMPGTMDGKPRPLSAMESRQRFQAGMPFSSLRNEAGKINKSLEEGNVDEALQQAQQVQEDLKNAMEKTRDFAESTKGGPPERREDFESSGKQCEAGIASVISELEGMKKALSPSLSQSQKGEMESLSKMQEQMRSETQSLMEEYNEIRQEAPSLPGEVGQQLGAAGSKMYDASGEMMLGEPGYAQVPARDARAHLEQAGESLNQAMNEMQGSMMNMGGFSSGSAGRQSRSDRDGGMLSEGEVELPGEDSYKVPEEFREEILKAMREESPDAYKNLNRDYYERLVR